MVILRNWPDNNKINFRGEYYLADYMQKLGNFNVGYTETVFGLEGYYDMYSLSANMLQSNDSQIAKLVSKRREGILHNATSKKRTYELIFTPQNGFLNNNLPLLTNCELKLSFDRCNAELGLLEIGTVTNSAASSSLVISDAYVMAKYVSSERMRRYFDQIERGPISYHFDDIEVLVKALPQDETIIRLDNIRGGSLTFHNLYSLFVSKLLAITIFP